MGLKKQTDKHPLYRKVTHTSYTGIKKIGDKGPKSWLPKTIISLDKFFYKTGKYGYSTMNDEYIEARGSIKQRVFPIGKYPPLPRVSSRVV